MSVTHSQRFRKSNPCPICGGWDQVIRGKGQRCWGYLSDDSAQALCARMESAGPLPYNDKAQGYWHKLQGTCGCGVPHSPVPMSRNGHKPEQREIVAVYDYETYEVVRFQPKGFAQRRKDGQWGLGNVTPHLYRRSDLLAADPQELVLVVEGEKDVESARNLGYVATCNPMGAGKWRDAYSQDLAGRHGVIIPDSDAPGRKHAHQVAVSIQPVAISLKVVALPEGKDFSDWLDLGHARADLDALIASAPLWTPPPSSNGPPAADGGGVRLRRMADVVSEAVTWLWQPYVPLGKLTLLEGDPGVGKSWVALAIATAVSLGRGLSGMEVGTPEDVVVASAEDGLGDTLRPRLDAMGADVGRIHAIDGPLTLDDAGFLALESAIGTVHPRLLVLDPLVAYLGGGVDIHRANEVRHVMAALARLADSYGLSILAVRHLAKGGATKAIYRGLGSIDFTAACRSVLLAGHAADNPQARGLVHIKSNLAPIGPAIGYELRDGHFCWTGESSLTAADILAADDGAGASVLEEAVSFLLEELAAGPVPAIQVWKDSREAGLAERTVNRAKAKIGVVTHRQGSAGKRGGGRFIWHLPGGLHCQDSLFGNLGNVNHSESKNGANVPTSGNQNGVEV